jgi:hypothetical protein
VRDLIEISEDIKAVNEKLRFLQRELSAARSRRIELQSELKRATKPSSYGIAEQILEACSSPGRGADIARKIGREQSQIIRTLHRLVAQGRLVRTGFVYSLPDKDSVR